FHGKSDYDYFYTEAAKRIIANNNASVVLFDYAGHGDSYGAMENISLNIMVDNLYYVLKNVVRTCLNYEKCLVFGIGIVGNILSCLFEKYPESIGWIKKTWVFSPTIKLYSSEEDNNLKTQDKV